MKIKLVQGDDAVLNFSLYDKEGNPLNLTGVTAITFKAKQTIDGDADIEKTLGAGVTITSATIAPQVSVAITHTDSNELCGKYLFELQITDGSGNISTVRDINDTLGELVVFEDLDE